jgi:hypothetical protein
MIKSVVSKGMLFGNDSLENFGMFLNIFTNAKESGLGVVLFQFVQDPGRNFGYWAVIKGKIDSVFFI